MAISIESETVDTKEFKGSLREIDWENHRGRTLLFGVGTEESPPAAREIEDLRDLVDEFKPENSGVSCIFMAESQITTLLALSRLELEEIERLLEDVKEAKEE